MNTDEAITLIRQADSLEAAWDVYNRYVLRHFDVEEKLQCNMAFFTSADWLMKHLIKAGVQGPEIYKDAMKRCLDEILDHKRRMHASLYAAIEKRNELRRSGEEN